MTAQFTAQRRKDAAQDAVRFVMAYRWMIPVVAVLSFFWSVLFAMQGNWVLSISQAVVVCACLASLLLAKNGQVATALLAIQAIFLICIVMLCLVFDVPSATSPRVSHLFLLVLAVAGYLNHKRQPSIIQFVLISCSVVGFVVLSSTNYVLPFALPIAEEVRIYGAWVNAAIATLMLLGGIHMFELEVQRSDDRKSELTAALWGRQFELFYQPQVGLDGRLIGAEALLRWNHPTRGYVSPGEFIPLAEQFGLMSDIGWFVLETACQTLVNWRSDPASAGLTLAVNVSASQFLDEDFEHSVVEMLDRYGVDPSRLKLEVTESVMISNVDLVAKKMQVLRSIGIGLSLDDFGTGYSSLAYIRRLPLTQLKIDRSFVQEITGNERSAALARSIVQLGHDLGLSVLAEGVETAEQYEFLHANGCEEFQGYYFGRPVPLAQFQPNPARQAA